MDFKNGRDTSVSDFSPLANMKALKKMIAINTLASDENFAPLLAIEGLELIREE